MVVRGLHRWEQAEQQRQRREHQAALPGPRPGAHADRAADVRAPGSGAGIPAAGVALAGLRRVHLRHRLSSLTAGHCCILGSWVGSAYIGGQP